MDWMQMLQVLVMTAAGIVIPFVGVYLRRYVHDAKDKARVEKLDAIAEGALELIMINNPSMGILTDIDRFKDMLVAELLKDPTVPLNNALVANRVAAKAISRAKANA